MEKHSRLKFLLFILLIAAALYLVKFSPYSGKFTIDSIRGFVDVFGFAGWIVFIAIYGIAAALMVPVTLMTFIGAVLFGPTEGLFLNIAGFSLGASLAFFVARRLGRDFVKSIFGKHKKLQKMVERHGFSGLFFLRIFPLEPFGIVNYVCGLSSIKFADYFLATLLGFVPETFIMTYFFAKISEHALSGSLLSELMTPEFLLPAGLMLLFILATLGFRYRKKLSAALPRPR
jgi:uncharacterized membrane protein YdjX (TVP38/TMEM64 family)